MTKEKVTKELEKTYSLIEHLKDKAKQLEDRKKTLEDMETLKLVKKIGISSEKLQLLNHLNQEEIMKLLEEKAKGHQHHENYMA